MEVLDKIIRIFLNRDAHEDIEKGNGHVQKTGQMLKDVESLLRGEDRVQDDR